MIVIFYFSAVHYMDYTGYRVISMISEQSISVNGIETCIRIREGSDPAIICIHGNSLTQHTFSPLLNRLSQHRNRLISYDLPGHGKSGRAEQPETTYTLNGYAVHLSKLIEKLGISQMILIGHSLGGHIALESVNTGLVNDPVSLHILGSPPISRLKDFGRAFCSYPDGASIFSEKISPAEAEILAGRINSNRKNKAEIIRSIVSTDPVARKYLMESLLDGKFHDEQAFLEKTSIPVTLYYGENERMVNPGYLKESRLSGLIGSRIKWIPKGDHLPEWDQFTISDITSEPESINV